MAKKNKVKRGRGRPVTVKWSRAGWKTQTDKEISEKLGCSVPAVFNKRKALIAAAEASGKSADKFRCKKPAYTRSATILKARKAAKVAKASNKG